METENLLKKMMIIGAICLVLFLIYLLKPILTPFLVGMGIAYLGDPLVDKLEGRLGRTGGVIIVFILIFGFLLATLFLLVPMLISEISSLVQSMPVLIQWLQQTLSPILIKSFGVDPFSFSLTDLKSQLTANWQQLGSVARQLIGKITASGFSMALAVANLALIPVVSFYLMRDWDILVGYMRELLPRENEIVTVKLVNECDEVLSAFIRGQLLVMLVLGCVYATGLMLFGLELALLIGMIAGLASIVPYLGFFVGIAAASIAAFIQFDESYYLIYVAIVFGVGQMLEAWVLTPLLVGDRIGLHPVAVIFAILAGGQLFGFIGILLALPMAAVIMVFIRHVHSQYKESDYYGALSNDNDDSGKA